MITKEDIESNISSVDLGCSGEEAENLSYLSTDVVACFDFLADKDDCAAIEKVSTLLANMREYHPDVSFDDVNDML